MTLEETLANLNEWHFFREFVYSENTFSPTPQQELELADNLLWLGDILVAYQLKERMAPNEATQETERKWFENKVVGDATSQMRDTVRYLRENPTITLRNHRGHERRLVFKDIATFHRLVVYLPSQRLPPVCLETKAHISKTEGLIHVIAAHDYLRIVRTLLTPTEFADYLSFRANVIEKWEKESRAVPEEALIGQYLSGEPVAIPSPDYIKYLLALDRDTQEWDISGIISNFSKRMVAESNSEQYYLIIGELACLCRNELKEFKRRFFGSLEEARSDRCTPPYGMVSSRGCGFVFVPMTKELYQRREVGLQNLTEGYKYLHHLSKCIGVAIGDVRSDRSFVAHWCYLSSAWKQDGELDKALTENNPFRPTKIVKVPLYRFNLSRRGEE
ncbi:MAG: hypothetical protein M0Z85_01255 [Gammaproteobacteria bacterium]|nr:hypothetical protein [Gammaproteobacteria bacterium]